MTDRQKLEETIFSFERLAKRVKTKEDKQKVRKILDECVGEFSPKVVDGIAKFLNMTFIHLYDGINFEEPEGQNLKELVKNNCVVLVPNHQSHADYIALTYAVWAKYRIPIYVAGGINLNIWPMGYLFRNAGCFFIRRTFGHDILYKLTLEAYLYYLMKEGLPIEFFFEGGRSRTGKLLPPRFGFFSMLLEVYSNFKTEINRPLMFIPVSINHEVVPETKAHAKELAGGQKKKESTRQLLKLYKLFSYKLGSINIKMGKPIVAQEFKDLRDYTHQMAFECYREVGKQMMVTPTSLLAMVLLDEPSGALTWNQIYDNCQKILDYCRSFGVPLSKKLDSNKEVKSIKRALSMLVNNKKVTITKQQKLFQDYYSIKKEARPELLYFKNTILHHFIVPYIICACWVNLFNGTISDINELKRFLLNQRKQLKYEFYLPTVKELMTLGLEIISKCIGRPIASLEEAMDLEGQNFYKIISTTGVFARAFNYLFEAYYLSALTLKHLGKSEFTQGDFLKNSKEIYELERAHGQMIKYPESYAQPLLRNSLIYYENQQVLKKQSGKFTISSIKAVDNVMDHYARHLMELLTINLKIHAN